MSGEYPPQLELPLTEPDEPLGRQSGAIEDGESQMQQGIAEAVDQQLRENGPIAADEARIEATQKVAKKVVQTGMMRYARKQSIAAQIEARRAVAKQAVVRQQLALRQAQDNLVPVPIKQD